MSKKDKKRLAKARGEEAPAKANLPAVIALSDKSESGSLLQAATNPEAALKDKVVDAEFEEAPVLDAPATDVPERSDEELTAEIIAQEEAAADAEHPADVLFNPDEEPPEVGFANRSMEILSEGGQKLLNWMNATGKAIAADLKKAKLKAIAWGNDVWDATKKLGNKLWAAYDYTKEHPDWLYTWCKAQQVRLEAWAVRTQAESREFLKAWQKARHEERELRAANVAKLVTALVNVNESIRELKETHEKEMRLLNKRIAELEKATRKEVRAKNRLADKTEKLDPEEMEKLNGLVSKGQKAKAISLYRSMTECTLEDAKTVIEAMSA